MRTTGVLRTSEKQVLKACRQLLDHLQAMKKLRYRRLHVMPVLTGGRGWRKNTDMAGMPDLVIGLPEGVTLWVELKGDDGELREEQATFLNEWSELGHQCHVVYSVDGIRALLRLYGVKL